MKNSNLSPEEIYRFALRAARKMNMGDYAEDVAQTVVKNRLRGIGTKQHIKQSVVDAIRECDLSTNPRHGIGAIRKEISTEEMPVSYTSPPTIWEFEVDEIVGSLSGKQRAVFVLHFKWGMFGLEIAEILGISESRVGQILKRVTTNLRCRLTEGHPVDPT